MAEKPRARGEVLKAIREVELEGMRREEAARQKSDLARASVAADCAKLVEQAERDGREAMRKTLGDVRGECAALRQERIRLADMQSEAEESSAQTKMPAVSKMIFRKFTEEYDVKD